MALCQSDTWGVLADRLLLLVLISSGVTVLYPVFTSSIPNMKQHIHTTLFALFLLITAFQCRNELIVMAANADLRIEPNPILVTNNQGEFNFEFAFPPSKTLAKADSVNFQFLTREDTNHKILGTSTLIINPGTSKNETIWHRDKVFFETQMAKDTVPLWVNWTLNLKGMARTSPNLQIGRLIKNER